MRYNDSLRLPEFEDNLWHELAALHTETTRSGHGNGSLGAGERPARLRLLAAAAAAAVIAGAGAIVVSIRSSDDPADGADVRTGQDEPAPSEGETPGGPAPDAEGSGQAQSPPDAIVHVVQVNADGTVDHRWSDEASARSKNVSLNASGDPVLESGWTDLTRNDDGTVTVSDWTIDHAARTYTESRWTSPMPMEESSSMAAVREDDLVRQGLADGTSVEDGVEMVDGQELLRIVDVTAGDAVCASTTTGFRAARSEAGAPTTTTPASPTTNTVPAPTTTAAPGSPTTTVPADPTTTAPSSGGTVPGSECASGRHTEPDPSLGVTWVDPETYRPVKRLAHPGTDAEYTMTFEYLQRTPENMALLEPEIPEGYTED